MIAVRFITESIARGTNCRCLVNSELNFLIFRLAKATRCTYNEGKIWRGRIDIVDFTKPNLTFVCAEVGMSPRQCIFYLILEHNRLVWTYTLHQTHFFRGHANILNICVLNMDWFHLRDTMFMGFYLEMYLSFLAKFPDHNYNYSYQICHGDGCCVKQQEGQHPLTRQRAPPISGGT